MLSVRDLGLKEVTRDIKIWLGLKQILSEILGPVQLAKLLSQVYMICKRYQIDLKFSDQTDTELLQKQKNNCTELV